MILIYKNTKADYTIRLNLGNDIKIKDNKIDGKTCNLVGPTQFSSYDGTCYFDFKSKVGQTLKMDIQ